MPTAYILVNTEIGAEKQVLKALKKVEGVQEAHSLWGVYDIIASVKAESMEELKYIITNQIEKISRITSKLTMLTNEKKLTSPQDHVVLDLAPIIQ
jgi:DNA-binding Lrp family transcriptional regulator